MAEVERFRFHYVGVAKGGAEMDNMSYEHVDSTGQPAKALALKNITALSLDPLVFR